MNTIKSGQTLKARSLGDHDSIYELRVIERKGDWATVSGFHEGRVKVRVSYDGHEYLRPKNYSMAPGFYALP